MKRLPAFSVILVFVVLIVIGAGMIPLLNIQYTPSERGSEIRIDYSWSGASAKLMEVEVTSKLEGLIASVSGVKNISSVSRKERGSITVELKDKKNMELVRFEIASLIRQVYPKLPEDVSYPLMSVSSSGTNDSPILTFIINADLPTQQIESYTEDNIVKELALVEGVSSVNLSGATPFYVEVAFDPEKLSSLGITISELSSAINSSVSEYDIVGSYNKTGILLKHDVNVEDLGDIPVKNVEGRIIRVGDVAGIEYRESIPTRYYRINGLNTINVSVYPEKFVNTIDVCNAVKQKMKSLEAGFPDKFSVITSSDSSIELNKELNKILMRTALSLLILLVFVYAASRSLKYLFVIFISLIANILIAFIFYVLFDLEIHIYSLAGITVSLGIIIDTSIVMISHYGYYKNKKVFVAILGAQLTTIGALSVIFLLPEKVKTTFTDFSAVIIINLFISLLISMFFIPALVDTLHVRDRESISKISNKRGVIRFNRLYAKYINFAKKYKWVTFIILILGFGLPVSKLPDKLGSEARTAYYRQQDEEEKKDNFLIIAYNKTLGSDFFKTKLKDKLDLVLGGSFRLFLKHSSSNLYRSPTRPNLSVRASLPDGCTISQLNEIVLYMENFLSQFEEIESFKTAIASHSNASITITFKKEAENTSFPLMLKSEIISKAIDFGGANWSVYGIDDQGFNNSVYSSYKDNRIAFTGYNYDELYRYCQNSVKELSKNARVSGTDIFGQVGFGTTLSRSEYFIDYDPYILAANNLSKLDAYTALRDQLYVQSIGSYYNNGVNTAIRLVSANKAYFDVWNLNNEYIKVGDKSLKFSDIGKIEKHNSGNDIYKQNQQYRLIVAYDFVGPHELAGRVMEKEIDRLNYSVLPIGYKAGKDIYSWNLDKDNNVALLLLVIVIIYFICAILFESLIYPLIIIGLIPVSFIGLFLIFAITGSSFDQGGYAALVMLCGIVVNAGIYLLSEYKTQLARGGSFIRAYNHKIIPILLTVLSTLLGLVPFLFDGKDEVFWFAFALGTIGGLLFSLIALIFFLPVWLPQGDPNKHIKRVAK